eukprot:6173545-Pleurochrysis_carterae.AAC.2
MQLLVGVANKKNAAAVSELYEIEAQVQRLKKGGIWARVHEKGGNKAHTGGGGAAPFAEAGRRNATEALARPAARRSPRSDRSWPTCAIAAGSVSRSSRATRCDPIASPLSRRRADGQRD